MVIGHWKFGTRSALRVRGDVIPMDAGKKSVTHAQVSMLCLTQLQVRFLGQRKPGRHRGVAHPKPGFHSRIDLNPAVVSFPSRTRGFKSILGSKSGTLPQALFALSGLETRAACTSATPVLGSRSSARQKPAILGLGNCRFALSAPDSLSTCPPTPLTADMKPGGSHCRGGGVGVALLQLFQRETKRKQTIFELPKRTSSRRSSG